MREQKTKKSNGLIAVVVVCLLLVFGVAGSFVIFDSDGRPLWSALSDEDAAVIAETTQVRTREYLAGQRTVEQSVGYIYLEDLTDEELNQLCETVSETVSNNVMHTLSADTLATMESEITKSVTEQLSVNNDTSLSQEDIDYIADSIVVIVEQTLLEQLENKVSRSELNEVTNQLNTNINNLSTQVSELNSKYVELSTQMQTLASGVNTSDTPTQQEVILLQTNVTQLESQISELENQFASYQTNTEMLVSVLGEDLRSVLNEHTNQIIELQESLASLQQEVVELSTLSNERYEQLETMITSNVDTTNTLLQETTIELTSYIEGNSTDINNVKATLEETRISLTEYVNLTNSGQDEYLNELIESIEVAVDTINDGIAGDVDNLEGTIADINSVLSDALEDEVINRNDALSNLSTSLSNSISNYKTATDNALTNLEQSTQEQLDYLRENMLRYEWSTDEATGEDMLTIITPKEKWNG